MAKEEKKRVETSGSNAKCPNCGNNLVFDPVTQKLKCDACSSLFEIAKDLNVVKHPITGKEDTTGHQEWAKEAKVVKCGTCGAEIVVNGLDITQKCPYCGNDYVIETKEIKGLQPDAVVPFTFDHKGCAEHYKKGIKKKFFAPRDFKKNIPESYIHGLYVPTFVFDNSTTTVYSGILVQRIERRDAEGHVHVTYIDLPIAGTYDLDFKDYVFESSSKIKKSDINALLPYDFEQCCVFTADYIRGFATEHYDTSLAECYDDAKKEMEGVIKTRILSQYVYSSIKVFTMKTKWSNEQYSYRLLPIYCVEFDWKKKHYINYVNGQTGRVGGGYPKSVFKIVLTVLIAAAIVAGIVVGVILSMK